MRRTTLALSTALVTALATTLVSTAALAQPAPKPGSGDVRIAPGTPATVGRNGAVTGVTPGQTTKVPEGTKSLGTTERSGQPAPRP